MRLGDHAYDRSFSEVFVAFEGCNISIAAAGGASLDLVISAVPEAESAAKCHSVALVPIGRTTWYRSNSIVASVDRLTFHSAGLGTASVYATAPSDSHVSLPNGAFHDEPHLVYDTHCTCLDVHV